MLLINQAKSERNSSKKLQLAQTIIKQLPVDVNLTSYSGDSPLHLACSCDCLPLVQALVDKGAIVNEKNVYRKTDKDMTTNKEVLFLATYLYVVSRVGRLLGEMKNH